MTDYLFHLLWTNTWQSVLMTVLLLIVLTLLGNRLQPRFRYLLWCVILLRLALPVLPNSPWGVWNSPVSSSVPTDIAAIPASTVAPVPEPHEFRPVQPVLEPLIDYAALELMSTSSLQEMDVTEETEVIESSQPVFADSGFFPFLLENWKNSVLLLWFFGLLLFGTRYLLDELRLYRQSRYWRPISNPKILAVFEQARKKVGVLLPVRLFAVSNRIGAASTGIFRPKILLCEEAVQEMDERAIEMVLLHELTHIRRFDPIVLRLATILSLIYWPNPVAWFLVSRLQRDRELACDAAVLNRLSSTSDWHLAETPDLTLGRTLNTESDSSFHPYSVSNHLTRNNAKKYGHTILTFATLFSNDQRLPGLVGVFQQDLQKKLITRRIDMIMKHEKPRFLSTLFSSLLVLFLAAIGLTQASQNNEQQTQTVQSVQPTQTDAQPNEKADNANEVSPDLAGPPQQSGLKVDNEEEGSSSLAGPHQQGSSDSVPAKTVPVQPVDPRILKPTISVNLKGNVLAPNGEPLGDVILCGVGFYEYGKCVVTSEPGLGAPSSPFSLDLMPGVHFTLGILDRQGRYTAPLRFLTVQEDSPEEEMQIQTEKGTSFRLTLTDRDSNEPIPNFTIVLFQRFENPDDSNQKGQLSFQLRTDEKGEVNLNLMPGEYIYSLDYRYLQKDFQKKDNLYAKEFVIEEGKPVTFDVRIPRPFQGRILDTEGNPVSNAPLFSTGEFSNGQVLLSTKTDENGIFRTVEPLKNRVLQIHPQGPKYGEFLIPIGEELVGLDEYTFHLPRTAPVSGRLLDSKTKEPLGNRVVNVRPVALPNAVKIPPTGIITQEDGTFSFDLDATLRYDIYLEFVVEDKENLTKSRHAGQNPMLTKQLVLATGVELQPETPLNLGDILVDPEKAENRATRRISGPEKEVPTPRQYQGPEKEVPHPAPIQYFGPEPRPHSGLRIVEPSPGCLVLKKDDVIVFENGEWKNVTRGRVLPPLATLVNEPEQIWLQLLIVGSEGQVRNSLGPGVSGLGKSIRISNMGRNIEVSGSSEEKQEDIPFIPFTKDMVIVFEDGKWKEETTGKEFPVGTLIRAKDGIFRLDVIPGTNDGMNTPIWGGGAYGDGAYIRWKDEGNSICNAQRPGKKTDSELVVAVYPLAYIEPVEEQLPALRAIFPDAKIELDKKTTGLIFYGTEDEHTLIKALLKKMNQNTKQSRTMSR
ncbi:MAG: M56 family metallopeptidase [Thermoguttaceae bacterium]